MASNRNIKGRLAIRRPRKITGWLATGVVIASSIAMMAAGALGH